jgi:F420-0:gamma-glutamyl ligase-like protein
MRRNHDQFRRIDPWQTKQRLVRTRLAGALPQKTATIAARVAKEVATQSSLTATVAIPVAQETFKEFTSLFARGAHAAPLFPFSLLVHVVGRIIQSRERSDRVALKREVRCQRSDVR